MTPLEAARLVAERGAPLGHSIMRTADAILLDAGSFAVHYQRAATRCERIDFPELLDAHEVLATYHAARKDAARKDTHD